MSTEREIGELVEAINACWIEGRYEDLRRYFHEEMVLVTPDFRKRLEGVGPIIDSYRDYGEQATVHSFEAEEPRVDVFGTAAITATPFTIEYEFEGARSREAGVDLLMLTREPDGWQVRWRTLVSDPA